jgi:hypothetical protein
VRREALLNHMVEEALAYVQGESLKANAALLTEAFKLPDHQAGDTSMSNQKVIASKKDIVAIISIIAIAIIGIRMCTGGGDSKTPPSLNEANGILINRVEIVQIISDGYYRLGRDMDHLPRLLGLEFNLPRPTELRILEHLDEFRRRFAQSCRQYHNLDSQGARTG